MKCQYLVQRDVQKMPTNWKMLPIINIGRNSPASVNRPVKVPRKNRRKTVSEPMKDISKAERSGRSVGR